MIDSERKVHVIRRKENLDYVQELEAVPEHLASRSVVPKSEPQIFAVA
jgi:hypothetical protein